jgi:Fe-S-cluster containining protein
MATNRDANSLGSHCSTCLQATHCCYRSTVIIFMPHERDRIVEATGRSDAFVPEGDLYAVRKAGGTPCPFLGEDRRCTVYALRPTDCRSWPVTVARGYSAVYAVDTDCPAVVDDDLSGEFIDAALRVLEGVPGHHAKVYERLVHEDVFNLVNVDRLPEVRR